MFTFSFDFLISISHLYIKNNKFFNSKHYGMTHGMFINFTTYVHEYDEVNTIDMLLLTYRKSKYNKYLHSATSMLNRLF